MMKNLVAFVLNVLVCERQLLSFECLKPLHLLSEFPDFCSPSCFVMNSSYLETVSWCLVASMWKSN
uniref:Uncharacterized protein n=2 Tax=Arundo donax TaxID=35708 RepID=A0A0A9F489_ARUDO